MEVVLKRWFLAKQGHLHSAKQTRGGYTFIVKNADFYLWIPMWQQTSPRTPSIDERAKNGMLKVVAKNVRLIR